MARPTLIAAIFKVLQIPPHFESGCTFSSCFSPAHFFRNWEVQKVKQKKPYTLLNKAEPYLWILPSVILMAVFIIVPIGYVFRMAFSQVTKAGLVRGFCGFDNFTKAVGNAKFGMVLKNTDRKSVV